MPFLSKVGIHHNIIRHFVLKLLSRRVYTSTCDPQYLKSGSFPFIQQHCSVDFYEKKAMLCFLRKDMGDSRVSSQTKEYLPSLWVSPVIFEPVTAVNSQRVLEIKRDQNGDNTDRNASASHYTRCRSTMIEVVHRH